ncbi:MAG: tetratricopeptide repeat protein [Pseudomonadota bacterium]|nr:tetratricopeptide repeat protein [Pseudomonadota bacterium]
MSYPRSRFDQHDGRFHARRVFVDRDNYIREFTGVIDELQATDKVVVWNIYGDPGIGKSRLAAELHRLAVDRRRKQVAACHLDFAVPAIRVAEDALYFIRQQLPFRCNTFEFAFARYWTFLGRSMAALESKRAIKEGSLLLEIAEFGKNAGASLAEAGGFIPGIGLLFKLAGAAGNKLRKWLHKHQGLLREMEELSLVDLRDRLAYYLGVDVRDEADNGWTTVFVFDSFERLTDPPESWSTKPGHGTDQWVRDLLSTSRRTSAVILSRRMLPWSRYASEAWGDSFVPSLIDRLDPRDVEDFLEQVPISDPGLRTHITKISGGSPFLIDLCLDAWEKIVESGREPLPKDIGINAERIIERFMAGRSIGEYATIKALSFPEVFDEGLFRFVVRELPTGYPASEFDDFAELSFVKKLEGSNLFHLHHSMREAVLLTLTPSERDRLTKALLRYCRAEALEPEADSCLVILTLGFQLLLDRPEAASWLYGAARDLIGAGYWPTVDRLLSEFAGRLDDHGKSVTALIRSLVLRRWGQIDEAIAAHREGRPALIAPYSSFAEFHHANLVRIKGGYDDAEQAYQRISDADRTDLQTRVLAQNQLADLLMLKGSFRRSREVLDSIRREGIEPAEEAELLRQEGHIFRWNFRADDATATYERALSIATAHSLRSLIGRLETNLLELHALCRTDPGDLLERALHTNEMLGARLEIGKVRCARAMHYTVGVQHFGKARQEIAEGLRCFRRSKYRAGLGFVLVARVLLDVAGDPSRVGRSLERLIELTNSLGVYGFLARGLYDTLGLPVRVRPAGRVFWVDRSHALASWKNLIAAARADLPD